MENYVLTVTLNPAIDKTFAIPDYQNGHDHRVDAFSLSAGGKGVNVSRALKKLGVKTLATGFVGGLHGLNFKEMLVKECIPSDFLTVVGETRTSLTILDPKNNRSTRVLEKGPIIRPGASKAFKEKFISLVEKSSHVVFSGRNVYGVGDKIYFDLIKIAHRFGKFTILDTSSKPLLSGLKAKPFLVKPNREELETIMGKKMNSQRKIVKAIEFLLESGIQNVIVSIEGDGVIASNGRSTIWAKPPSVKPLNTVGCGDALIGGFIFAHKKKFSFDKCIKIAVATGTANTLSIQPGKFTNAKVVEMAKRVKIKEI